MRTIHKFRLGDDIITDPNAKFLCHRHYSHSGVYVWLEVDPEAEKRWLEFKIIGTGWELHEDWEYCATYFEDHFVWHIYLERNNDRT